MKRRSAETEVAVFDTPGQIEVFTWSASGTIIAESLAALFPTVVVYVMDVVRSVSAVTFMSNMLYACSILYKLRLPFIIVMNKVPLFFLHRILFWKKKIRFIGFDGFHCTRNFLHFHWYFSVNLIMNYQGCWLNLIHCPRHFRINWLHFRCYWAFKSMGILNHKTE